MDRSQLKTITMKITEDMAEDIQTLTKDLEVSQSAFVRDIYEQTTFSRIWKMRYIVDTGVLVAYLNRRDNLHEWACRELDRVSPPLLTCEAVVAESCYLLQGSGGDEAILKMIEDGYLEIPFRLSEHAKEVCQTLSKYKKNKVSFADASLVRMLELIKGGIILTTDSDFEVYRIHRNRRISVIHPN